jgi:hypothetical protein
MLVGCAHVPEAARAAPDQRPLVIEFHGSRCEPCDLFDRKYLPDPTVRAALAHVRFERYDLDTFSGNTAYRRYVGGRVFRPMPSFVGVVDDRTVSRMPGLPPRIERFVEFVDKVAALGGTELVPGTRSSRGRAPLTRPSARLHFRYSSLRMTSVPTSSLACWACGASRRAATPRPRRWSRTTRWR